MKKTGRAGTREKPSAIAGKQEKSVRKRQKDIMTPTVMKEAILPAAGLQAAKIVPLINMRLYGSKGKEKEISIHCSRNNTKERPLRRKAIFLPDGILSVKH